MQKIFVLILVLLIAGSILYAQTPPSGGAALGTKKYEQYEKPEACKSCHTDFYQQWTQAMMSQQSGNRHRVILCGSAGRIG